MYLIDFSSLGSLYLDFIIDSDSMIYLINSLLDLFIDIIHFLNVTPRYRLQRHLTKLR